MNLHKFLSIKAAETGIKLTVAADAMGVKYKTLYTRIVSGKLDIVELLQFSDIYGFSMEELKGKIEYKQTKIIPVIKD